MGGVYRSSESEKTEHQRGFFTCIRKSQRGKSKVRQRNKAPAPSNRKIKKMKPGKARALQSIGPVSRAATSVPVQNFRGGRCFWKQSLQYTGRPSVGLNGTSQSFPQSEHFVLCISLGPPKPPLLSLSPYPIFSLSTFPLRHRPRESCSFRRFPFGKPLFYEPSSPMVCLGVHYSHSI